MAPHQQPHQQEEQWPLKDDDNLELILPPELYWNYVFPYTAVDDRIIINKHTKSTKYNAGHRAEIDAAYLIKYGYGPSGLTRISGFTELSFVMNHMGYGLTTNQKLKLKLSPDSDHFPDDDIVLGLLRCGRWCWDKHISMIEHPSERLLACLKLFYCTEEQEEPEGIPLLFPEGGRVEDVVRHHVSMNPNAINGHVKVSNFAREKGFNPHFNRTFPQTPFGIWLERYLRTAQREMSVGREYTFMGDIYLSKHIVEALFEVGGDYINVDPFFKPLDSCLPNECGEDFYFSYYFKPGMSIVDCLRRYSEAMKEIPDDVQLPRDMATIKERIHELDWVISKLEELNEAKKKSKQGIRFGWAGIASVLGAMRQYLWGERS